MGRPRASSAPASSTACASSACLAPDPELRADLTGLDYGYSGKGEIQLEKKEDMKKRGLASPDIADALALTFAHPITSGSWDLPPAQQFYETEYDPFAKFNEDYWWPDNT